MVARRAERSQWDGLGAASDKTVRTLLRGEPVSLLRRTDFGGRRAALPVPPPLLLTVDE